MEIIVKEQEEESVLLEELRKFKESVIKDLYLTTKDTKELLSIVNNFMSGR